MTIYDQMLVREHEKRDNVHRIKSQNNDASNRLNNCNAIAQLNPPRVVLSARPGIALKKQDFYSINDML